MKLASILIGTRPEAIKMGPLASKLKKSAGFSAHVCVTGQHREMLDPMLKMFDLSPDADLSIMRPNQTLAETAACALSAIDKYLLEVKPDLVLVQGDTTSSFCGALAAFYRRIPVGHVEAGLRTWDRAAPFPEEINRTFVSRIAEWHFAPTRWAAGNLIKEGISPRRVHVTGNTGIDALQMALKKIEKDPSVLACLPAGIVEAADKGKMALITGHRRENFGKGFEAICRAIGALARRFEKVVFVYPVHLNPSVQEPVFRILDGLDNVHLIQPLEYLPFVRLMQRAALILTDSGGIQEEAASLGTPVLVMRESTERPEAVDLGVARLVGADAERIVSEASALLAEGPERRKRVYVQNPYGDGRAAERIVEILDRWMDSGFPSRGGIGSLPTTPPCAGR